MTVVLKDAKAAPACGLGRYVCGAGRRAVLGHGLLHRAIDLVVRREPLPGIDNLCVLGLQLAGCGYLLAGGYLFVDLLEQTEWLLLGPGLPGKS